MAPGYQPGENVQAQRADRTKAQAAHESGDAPGYRLSPHPAKEGRSGPKPRFQLGVGGRFSDWLPLSGKAPKDAGTDFPDLGAHFRHVGLSFEIRLYYLDVGPHPNKILDPGLYYIFCGTGRVPV